jgi:hypothetical protein
MKQVNVFVARLFAELYQLAKTNASSGIIILIMTICAAAITALTFVIGLQNIGENVIVGIFGFDKTVSNITIGTIAGVLSFFMYFTLFVLSLNQKPVLIDYIDEDGNLDKKLVTNEGLYWRSLITIGLAELVSVFYFISRSAEKIDFKDASKMGVLIISIAIMLCVQAVVISFLHTATQLFYRQGVDDRNVTNVAKENSIAADIEHKKALKGIGGAKGNESEAPKATPSPSQNKSLKFNV